MPNYISHAIMADKTNINSKIKLNKDLLRAYSIGPDLMISYKNGIDITHTQKTQSFFLVLISYIRNNKLYNNPEVMSYLYGQIMHYALDTTVHPYVYYMTNDVPKAGIVDFHMAFEEYLGNYLLQEKMGITREQLSNSFYTSFDWKNSLMVQSMLDWGYSATYSIKNASKYQIQTGKLLKVLDGGTKLLQKNNGQKYLQAIGLDKYLEITQLTKDELTNKNHEIWYDPITEQQNTASLLDLFDKAIDKANEIIEEVNKVIYNEESKIKLMAVFDNSSYDTGLDCRIGKPFVRSRIKDNNLI